MASQQSNPNLAPLDTFPRRHIGPSKSDIQEMLGHLGFTSLDDLIQGAVPGQIQTQRPLKLPANRSEQDILSELQNFANQNTLFRSYIGIPNTLPIKPKLHKGD
jgi:glycine dehydrogenase